MKITTDTNVLVRAAVGDDLKQARAAGRVLKTADLVAIPLPCLCEFVWVLRSVYGYTAQESFTAIESLINSGNVVTNRPAVEAGLHTLRTGGEFADGVIAYEGAWLGGEIFVSFDKKAVRQILAQKQQAKLLE